MSEIPSFWVSRLQVLLNSGGQNPFSDGAVKVWIKDIIRTQAQQHPALEHHSDTQCQMPWSNPSGISRCWHSCKISSVSPYAQICGNKSLVW